MSQRPMWLLVAAVSLAAVAAAGVNPTGAHAQGPPAVATLCPAPQPRAPIDVCVDRGDGAIYAEGSPITICVTETNLTLVPFRFTVRLSRYVDGVFQGVLFKGPLDGASKCFNSVTKCPCGQEKLLAEWLRPGGSVAAADTAWYQSVPAPMPADCRANRTVTLVDNGSTVALRIGERFRLDLPDFYTWTVEIGNPVVLRRVCSEGEGVYEGLQRGMTTVMATGTPVCYPLCLAPSILFRIRVVVY